MEKIIKLATEGGWKVIDMPNNLGNASLDPLFWQALGKAYQWKTIDKCWGCGYDEGATNQTPYWKYHALRFHEINLNEGWNKAVAYLQEVTQ